MTQALTLKQKVTNVATLLAKSKHQIALALPRHCSPERMMRVALTAVQRTPALLDCTPESFLGCMIQASQLGWEFDPILGHCFPVPFNNKKTGKMECHLIPGYKGLVDLARRSGNISTVEARVVHKKDEYSFQYGLHPDLRHIPTADEDPGPIIAFYAVVHLRDGAAQFEPMWKREVDAIRARSQARNDGPWVTDYAEMGKKTTLRRLCKLLPVSVELQKMVALDERAEAGIPQDLAAIVTVDSEDAEPASGLDGLADQLTEAAQPEPDAPAAEPPMQAEEAPPEPEPELQRTNLEEYKEAFEDAAKMPKTKGLAEVKRIRTLVANDGDLDAIPKAKADEWGQAAVKVLQSK